MNVPTLIYGLLFAGLFVFSCAIPSPAVAHQVSDQNGNATHRHVYKRNAYGKGFTAGHYAQPAGSRGIVIWQAAPNRGYRKAQPGFQVPRGHAPQPSQKKMYRQKPTFNKHQDRTPDFSRK